MPAKSDKQARFMQLCLHSPSKARKKCPSRKVAREFSHKSRKKKRRYGSPGGYQRR